MFIESLHNFRSFAYRRINETSRDLIENKMKGRKKEKNEQIRRLLPTSLYSFPLRLHYNEILLDKGLIRFNTSLVALIISG